MNATQTPCVPTLKDLTFVDVFEVMWAMERRAEVKFACAHSGTRPHGMELAPLCFTYPCK